MQVDPRKVNLAEADIEQYLWENPEVVPVRGTHIDRWIKRQFHLPSGIIDLLGVTAGVESLVVVEVKNTELKVEHIAQVKRYAYDIDAILCVGGAYEHQCLTLLIGQSISDSLFRDCEACNIDVLTFNVSFSLDVQRISWEEKFWQERDARHTELADDKDLAAYIEQTLKRDREFQKAIRKSELNATPFHNNGSGI